MNMLTAQCPDQIVDQLQDGAVNASHVLMARNLLIVQIEELVT